VNQERDLAIIVDNQHKFYSNCKKIVSYVNSFLGLLKTTIPIFFMKLHKALFRSVFDFGMCIASLRHRSDVELLEREQRGGY